MKLGSFNIFSNKSEKKEIGNLNCINIGGKFDTGHNKKDYKAISKFINNHLKKKTLKKEFEFKLKDKNINDTVNEVKIDKLSNFFVPKNFINEKKLKHAIMGYRIIDDKLLILHVENDQESWKKHIDYEGEVRSIAIQILELDNEEYNLLKPFEKQMTQGKSEKFLDKYFDLNTVIFKELFQTEKRKKYPINSFISLVGLANLKK